MEKGKPGNRYLLTGENVSFAHVFDIAAVITNTKRPFFNIPLWVIEAYGWLSVLFSRITGKLPIISPPTVHVLRHRWEYSCDKAKREFDYRPRSFERRTSRGATMDEEPGLHKLLVGRSKLSLFSGNCYLST